MVLRLIFIPLLLALFIACGAQVEKSSTGTFQLKRARFETTEDVFPPEIKIIEPEMTEGQILKTSSELLSIVGEVSDESEIRFISVNKDIMLAGETGMFISEVKLNPGLNSILIRSGDANSNISEKSIEVNYEPPIITLADKININSTYYALLIGIDEYSDENFDDLENPITDAMNLSRALVRYYTFEKENVEVLKNPTRSEIITALGELRSKVRPEDNVLIFYAGHGTYDDKAKTGYWLPADATAESTANWFENSSLVNQLRAIESKHTLLITDACFSGALFKMRSVSLPTDIYYDQVYDDLSRKAMTSGSMSMVPDESVFIQYLIKGLSENKNRYLTSEELFSILKKPVIANSPNTPRFGEIHGIGDEGGDFIFLKR